MPYMHILLYYSIEEDLHKIQKVAMMIPKL